MTYPEDYGQPPQYPQQRPYGQAWPPQYQQGESQPPHWQQQQSAMPPQPPNRQKRKSWPARHKVLTGLLAFGALFVIIAVASASNKPSTTASNTAAARTSTSPAAAGSPAAASSVPSTPAASDSAAAHSHTPPSAVASSVPSAPPAAPANPSLTGGQQQAVDSAEGYLGDGQGFSEQGLLSQLTSKFGEGFSTSDAEFAINDLNPNWDQQAVDSAEGYLSGGQGFSEQGLLQQLTSTAGEGFTEAQADYAISHLHPDWDAQAVDSAKSYLSDGQGFSRSSLIEQLTSSYGAGFTEAQAEYAVNKVMS